MLQETLFEIAAEESPSYRGDFHANPTALLGNVWHLMMNAICGGNSSECFARLAPDGLWEKMYQGCSQAKMDDSLDEFCETWPKWGVLHGGYLFQPTIKGRNLLGNGFALWQRPIASDGVAWLKTKKSAPMESIIKCWKNGKQDKTTYYHIQNGCSIKEAAELNEMMMGFPKGWTDLNASETQ